jgi:hypothetical protein
MSVCVCVGGGGDGEWVGGCPHAWVRTVGCPRIQWGMAWGEERSRNGSDPSREHTGGRGEDERGPGNMFDMVS